MLEVRNKFLTSCCCSHHIGSISKSESSCDSEDSFVRHFGTRRTCLSETYSTSNARSRSPASAAGRASSTALRVTYKAQQGLTEDGHPLDAASDFGKTSTTYAHTTAEIRLSEYDLQQCLVTGECDLPEGVEMAEPPPPKRSLLSRVLGRGNHRR